MNNPFNYSNDNKRYHTLNYYLKNKFGAKVCKIPLSGGFTCPNRDGSKSSGGCVFCSSESSGEFAGNQHDSISKQMDSGKATLSAKWPDSLFLPYFQPNSNTYASLEKLKPLYEEALSYNDTVGLCIATRPDCLEDDVCDYLSELSKRTNLYVELGLQTIHDQTANLLNRQHSYNEFLTGYNKLKSRGIRVCIHLMNSLPGETNQMMLETAKVVSELKPFGVKIHMLYIVKDTVLESWYNEGKFELMSREDYINIVCDQLEFLSPNIVIERLTGDCAIESLVAPAWSIKKVTILNDIDKELARRGSFQGSKLIKRGN